MPQASVVVGDALTVLRSLSADRFQTCITSPPYWNMRDYGVGGQLGVEATPEEWVANLVEVFREVRRVLRPDGCLWVNCGDSYYSERSFAGGLASTDGVFERQRKALEGAAQKLPPHPYLKKKDLVGQAWLLAFALQKDGWWLRSDVVWVKLNPKPDSNGRFRPGRSHEFVHLFSKSEDFYYNPDEVREPNARSWDPKTNGPVGKRKGPHVEGGKPEPNPEGRLLRDVWVTAMEPGWEGHHAAFPEALVAPCVKSSTRPGDHVLDPFSGSGTTGVVALRHGCNYTGIELNPGFAAASVRRLRQDMPLIQDWIVKETP